MSPTVIVEPDSSGAWIGLAGVAIGALLSTGATWLQRHFSDVKDQRRQVSAAADELLTSANSLLTSVDSLSVLRGQAAALFEWMPRIIALMERLQKADEAIAARKAAAYKSC